MEVWIYLALGAAIIVAILNLSIKDLGGKIDEYAAGFIRNLVMLPLLWVIVFSFGLPKVDPVFWKYILIMLPFEFVLINLYQKSFKLSPVSLIVPMLSLAPIFIAFVSFILFKEGLTIFHLASLILFASGVYVLNLSSKNKHILVPIKAVFRNKGVFYMLIVALILGVTVSLGKRAIVASSPQFFSAVYFSLVTITLFPMYKYKSKVSFKELFTHKKSLLLLGILNPLNLMLSFNALRLGPTAVAQSIISLNVLFSVILAGAFLKETGIKKRIFASLLILLGSVLIVLK